MLTFIADNLGTIAVSIILLAIVASILVRIVRDKRKGKPIGCDCDCSGCSKCLSDTVYRTK
ncbi:MAG: FeoB-associated Cys-rich membrane protein [Clostridiales Family XIII bacterium]|jgi:hypothetical protein|nr:FeoB-associated Cys-rich membrane protein [Clostridiales Family XIII bacterium]